MSFVRNKHVMLTNNQFSFCTEMYSHVIYYKKYWMLPEQDRPWLDITKIFQIVIILSYIGICHISAEVIPHNFIKKIILKIFEKKSCLSSLSSQSIVFLKMSIKRQKKMS